MKVMKWIVRWALWILLAGFVLWALGAVWFDFPWVAGRPWVALGFALAVLGMGLKVRPAWRAQASIAILCFIILGWWLTLKPTQEADWKPEVAVLPFATFDGDLVTLHNVRVNNYRTETDFDVRHETRTLDLRDLRGVDMFLGYWGSPWMAHPILSFDFGHGGRICFSIETRPKRGQAYSAVGGLYRQFELTYVVADERDVVRLRTNYRHGEDLYLYHLKGQNVRQTFMAYLKTVNDLHAKPRWYHALSNNCTTAIRNQRVVSDRPPWDWRMIANGYGDEMLYDRGALDSTLPFAELKQRSHINDRAEEADQSPDFSRAIRAGIPGMPD